MSFYTALTGLNAASSQLEITSNNIANVNTTGYKKSVANFGDIFASSPLQKASGVIGQGVALKQVKQQFSQGNIVTSSNALNMAISGDGFFQMKSADALQSIYTRDGTFSLNDQNTVVNSAGQALQAASVDSSGNADLSKLSNLVIPPKTSGDAKQTTTINLGLNLPADSPVITSTFNRSDPTTYNKSTAITVYDQSGNSYLATVYYVKTQNASQASPDNRWQTYVYVGETAVTAALTQATSSTGEKLYVNQYGQLAPESQVASQLVNGTTQMFLVDDLNNKQTSVPATIAGSQVTKVNLAPQAGVVFGYGTFRYSSPSPVSGAAPGSGDLVINGTLIPPGSTTDGQASTIAAAINAMAAQTGVQATGSNAVPFTFGGLNGLMPGDLVINGTPIQAVAPAPDADTFGANVAAEIVKDSGVKATYDPATHQISIDNSGGVNGIAIAASGTAASFFNGTETTLSGGVTLIRTTVEGGTVGVSNRFSLGLAAVSSGQALINDVDIFAGLPNSSPLLHPNPNDPHAGDVFGVNIAALINTLASNNTHLAGVSATYSTDTHQLHLVNSTGSDITIGGTNPAVLGLNAGVTHGSLTLSSNSSFTVSSNNAGGLARLGLDGAIATATAQDPVISADLIDDPKALSQMFSISIDGSNPPKTVDMSSLLSVTTPLTGTAIATALTNKLNALFGGGHYWDFSTVANQRFQIQIPDASGNPVNLPIDLGAGTVNPPVNSTMTTDQVITALNQAVQAAVTNSSSQFPSTPKITVSYDPVAQGFKFSDATDSLALAGWNGAGNNALGLSGQFTPVKQDGSYASSRGGVVPNGSLITPLDQQRYGIQVSYDTVKQTFSFSSGTTGDTSSISISNLSNLAKDIFGLSGNATIATSPKAVRGLASTPATMQGSPLAINAANNFSIDASNNTFVVSVNNVKGTVVLPPNPSQTLNGFLQQLQDGINSLQGADGETVSGVKVTYDPVNNAIRFTTGNTGDSAFIQVTSQAADWGLAAVTSGRGQTSGWIKPTQTVLNLNGQQVPQYIDAKGHETSSASGFTALPTWSPIYLKQGELTFNTAGQLVSPIQGTQLNTVYLADGKGALTINIDYAKSTQFTSAFAVASESQDGAPEGDLTGVNINDNGLVNASYSNGTQRSLGKVVLANFSNPTGLQQIGNSSYYASSSSGVAKFGQPGSAGFGTVQAGAHENANVDLTGELVDLITEQRNFQASAKAIDTDNQLTTTIIQIR